MRAWHWDWPDAKESRKRLENCTHYNTVVISTLSTIICTVPWNDILGPYLNIKMFKSKVLCFDVYSHRAAGRSLGLMPLTLLTPYCSFRLTLCEVWCVFKAGL